MIGEKVMMDVFQIYVERIFVIVKFDVIYKLEEIEDIILRLGFVILQVILEIGKINQFEFFLYRICLLCKINKYYYV